MKTIRGMRSVYCACRNEQLHLTDGKGNLLTAAITDPHKKKCRVRITGTQLSTRRARKTGIAVSLLKNPVRFEWFLEKATEIGVTDIFPLLCSRTEKQHFRQERMQNVLVSALLQSRQTWLPVLHAPTKFDELVKAAFPGQKFIAHCLEADKNFLGKTTIDADRSQLVLIGPEGDFTNAEIETALARKLYTRYIGRNAVEETETAGVVAAVLLKHF